MIGRFEQADGGTVFLDEIGEISSTAQIKLLRILQSQKFERIGGEQTLSVNVRVLAATNKNLLQEVKDGNFREDLFYRLNVIPIHLPPLRNRSNDIPLLARYFLRHFADEQEKHVGRFSSEAMRLLLDYSWPGNVRELENSRACSRFGQGEGYRDFRSAHAYSADCGRTTDRICYDHGGKRAKTFDRSFG